MILNEQLYNELKPFEQQLRSAYYGHYLSAVTTEMTLKLIEIAKKAHYNRQITATCSMCRLRLCTDLGEAFFKFQKTALESPKTEPVEQPSTTKEKVQQKPKKAARTVNKTKK